jgi:hypothetical protein
MQLRRHFSAGLAAATLAVIVLALGCSGSSSSGDAPASSPTGSVAMSVSDASVEDWAVVGVKLLGITLTPQGGGTPVTILASPATAPMLNLVQLDNLSEVLGTAQVPVGTYTQATLTLSGNAGDVVLTAANSPSASFDGTAGATIPAADIQIKGATGPAGGKTVAVPITLAQPLVVAQGQSGHLDVEFVLSHPAFIVDHVPASGATIWTVNFNGTVRHNLVADARQMVLRHLYGTVSGVSSSGSLTVTRDLPALPVASPETPVATLQSLQISADAANGTLFYDLDTPANNTTVYNFSTISSLLANGSYVRAAVRFQNGSLVAARLWASASFNSVWLGPEGHVTQVVLGSSGNGYQIYVESENGAPVAVAIDNATQFFFRTPAVPAADATPLATGTTFMDENNLVRGFKVHVSYVDPPAATPVAAAVDIETARYSGTISAASSNGFSYTHHFVASGDDYSNVPVGYIPVDTANGNDASGNPILGFKWWYLTEPTAAYTDSAATTNATSTAVASFSGTVTGNVNFGGTVGAVKAWGVSATIPDPAFSSNNLWDARWTVLEPTRLPKGQVVSPFTVTGTAGTFSMTVTGGNSTPVFVNLSTPTVLVYQIDLSGGVYSLNLVDLTSSANQSLVAANLAAGDPVVVYGVPQSGGTIIAYALYFTTSNAL